MRKTRAFVLLLSIAPVAPAAEKATEAALRLTHDSLGNQHADWSATEAELFHRGKNGGVVYGSLRTTRRFSLDDQEIRAGGNLPLSEDWSAAIEGSMSDSHKVLPRRSASAQLQRRFGAGWNIRIGVRRTEYDSASTTLGNLTAERYWGDYRAAFTAYSGRLEGNGTQHAGSMQLDRYYGAGSRLGLLLASGQEAESVGPGRVLVSHVRTAALVGSHWFEPSWALTWAATVQRQGNLYTRRGIELGIRWRF